MMRFLLCCCLLAADLAGFAGGADARGGYMLNFEVKGLPPGGFKKLKLYIGKSYYPIMISRNGVFSKSFTPKEPLANRQWVIYVDSGQGGDVQSATNTTMCGFSQEGGILTFGAGGAIPASSVISAPTLHCASRQ